MFSLKKFIKILILIFIFSNSIVFAGTRFRLTRREKPFCNYNPYSTGVIAVISGEKEGNVYYQTTDILCNFVSSSLSKEGFFSLVNREKIEKVLKEQAFSQTGFVDETQVVKLGKILGAKSIFIVKVENISSSYNQGTSLAKGSIYLDKKYFTEYNEKTNSYETPKKSRSIEVEVNYIFESIAVNLSASGILILTETGQELCHPSFSLKKEFLGVKPEDVKILIPERVNLKEKSYEKLESEARKEFKEFIKTSAIVLEYGKLPNEELIVDEILPLAGDKIASYITPPLVTREREIGNGTTPQSRNAVLKAKAGNWEEAEKLWKIAVEISPRDHDAWGGLGICYERKEMVQKARECYSKAREIDPENRGFPEWLKELDYMLNDYSEKLSKEKTVILEELPYVVFYDEKNKIVKLNPKENTAKVGDKIGILKFKVLTDPVSGEVLEISEEIKAIAEITEISEKIWTAKVLKINKKEKILIEDKGRLIKDNANK
jgi:hypothetical protein